jgi:Dockerin type I domain
VPLTGVTNAQHFILQLNGIQDSVGSPTLNGLNGRLDVLLGDVNANGLVDGNDVSAVQSQTRQPVSGMNFRADVNANGIIDGNDVSLTQGQTRTSLP